MGGEGSNGLVSDALAGLLARLDADRDEAGQKYEALRRTLVRFFDWRGAPFPDEAADESLDRLSRRIAEGESIADLRSYVLGIARLVWLERARGPLSRATPLDEAMVGVTSEPEDDAVDATLIDCFERCMQSLPDDGRSLILRYYTHERHGQIDARARLAAELHLTGNALRSRAQRVRDRLERCVRDCARAGTAPRASSGTDTKLRGGSL